MGKTFGVQARGPQLDPRSMEEGENQLAKASFRPLDVCHGLYETPLPFPFLPPFLLHSPILKKEEFLNWAKKVGKPH